MQSQMARGVQQMECNTNKWSATIKNLGLSIPKAQSTMIQSLIETSTINQPIQA